MPTPAERLQGIKLAGGWTVERIFLKGPNPTGGYFSQGYVVKNESDRFGYLKALDFSRAMAGADPALILQQVTAAFNYERDICIECARQRLGRIVQAILHGKVQVDPSDPMTTVQYLIFELAEGDIRKQMDIAPGFDLAWTLRTLHHAATGIKQLHGLGVFHQDVKPSNVLVFPNGKGSKLGDLGRSCSTNITAPHDLDDFSGDYSYAPPEVLYAFAFTDPNLANRRAGYDMYLLGSLLSFFFLRIGTTAAIMANIDPAHRADRRFGAKFDESIPFIREAFNTVTRGLLLEVPLVIRDDIGRIFKELCEPDPRLRGHPICRREGGSQYSLERYISEFDLLARKAELKIFR